MRNHTFYIVDVFAEEKYAGNQLAVVRGASDFTAEEMQQIAREMNYSETTFILSDERENDAYNVRIFTPTEEVPFAGHPTLGTAYIIQQEMIGEPVEVIKLNLSCGQIPVQIAYKENQPDILWMNQLAPIFNRNFDTDMICEIINTDRRKIDERFPIQEVSTGLPFIIVPIKTRESLRQIRIARDKYFDLVRLTQAKAILAFSPDTVNPDNQIHVRVFCDYYGIPEDPATGSANGCLAGYLVKNQYFGTCSIDIRVEQGYEVGRPSLLLLRAVDQGSKIDVHVGGHVIMVAKGELV